MILGTATKDENVPGPPKLIRSPTVLETLDTGEREVIQLAIELNPDLQLIDDRRAVRRPLRSGSCRRSKCPREPHGGYRPSRFPVLICHPESGDQDHGAD